MAGRTNCTKICPSIKMCSSVEAFTNKHPSVAVSGTDHLIRGYSTPRLHHRPSIPPNTREIVHTEGCKGFRCRIEPTNQEISLLYQRTSSHIQRVPVINSGYRNRYSLLSSRPARKQVPYQELFRLRLNLHLQPDMERDDQFTSLWDTNVLPVSSAAEVLVKMESYFRVGEF